MSHKKGETTFERVCGHSVGEAGDTGLQEYLRTGGRGGGHCKGAGRPHKPNNKQGDCHELQMANALLPAHAAPLELWGKEGQSRDATNQDSQVVGAKVHGPEDHVGHSGAVQQPKESDFLRDGGHIPPPPMGQAIPSEGSWLAVLDNFPHAHMQTGVEGREEQRTVNTYWDLMWKFVKGKTIHTTHEKRTHPSTLRIIHSTE